MTSPGELRLERGGDIRPETKEVAVRELRETPERVREALERLRELLKENKDLYYGDDDEILSIFLRPCKWYPESAIQLMRNVAQFKKEHHSVTHAMPADEEEAFLRYGLANVLKTRDHKGRRVMIVNCGGVWDPKKVNVDQIFKMYYLIHVASLMECETQINGCAMIMDYHNMGWSQAMAFTPSTSKRLLSFLQDSMPMRLKEVHIIRQPMIFNAVWNLFKPLIRQKLRNRLFFHGTKMSSLHKHIPASCLPADYGGELAPLDYSSKDWYPVLVDCQPFIEAWNTYGFAPADIQ